MNYYNIAELEGRLSNVADVPTDQLNRYYGTLTALANDSSKIVSAVNAGNTVNRSLDVISQQDRVISLLKRAYAELERRACL